jgi:hypothetical protein
MEKELAMRAFKATLFLASYLVALSANAQNQIQQANAASENLIVAMPQGYKVDFQAKDDAVWTTEMVPNNESVKKWSEMLTTQVFHQLRGVAPAKFRDQMIKTWGAGCPAATIALVAENMEHGYPVTVWVQTCPKVQATGKPEITYAKALQGNDRTYLVQKAFRFKPSDQQSAQWLNYLQDVNVCDSRISPKRCNANLTKGK